MGEGKNPGGYNQQYGCRPLFEKPCQRFVPSIIIKNTWRFYKNYKLRHQAFPDSKQGLPGDVSGFGLWISLSNISAIMITRDEILMKKILMVWFGLA
jgi:hypothetical protein